MNFNFKGMTRKSVENFLRNHDFCWFDWSENGDELSASLTEAGITIARITVHFTAKGRAKSNYEYIRG